MLVAAAVAAIATGARAQDGRLSASWVPMIEGCLAYAETGRRAVFDGWTVAATGGGVCDGDPGCAGDEMTFVVPGAETGAVTVRVGSADWVGARHHGRDPAERMVGSAPAHAFCASAETVRHSTRDIDAVHGAWLDAALEAARLVPAEGYVSRAAGPYLGCGYDGRRFLVEFSLSRPGRAILRLNYPTRFAPRDGEMRCAGPVG